MFGKKCNVKILKMASVHMWKPAVIKQIGYVNCLAFLLFFFLCFLIID